MPQGFHGITAIFDLYLDAMNRRVARRIDHDPADNLIRKALERLAKEMYEKKQHALSRREARDIANELLPGRPHSKSLFQAMLTEGVLLQEAHRSSSHEREEQVLITSERFSDHVIADYLIDAYFDSEDPPAAFSVSGGLAFLRSGDWWRGPVEALCVQFPEKCGRELFGLIPEALDYSGSVQVFLESLVWRETGAFSDETHSVLKTLIEWPEGLSARYFFDTLLTVATIPDHVFNADYLDSYLRQVEMPVRDAQWSTYLHDAYGEESSLDRILDWSTSLSLDDARRLDGDAVSLCGIALAWALTSSNRFVRDRATKGLVTLFTGRLDGLRQLAERFHRVDDPYVVERIYAVAYGVATRCHAPEEITSLANSVYRFVFADAKPPPHILLRDYARGVVERALHLGADVDIDESLIRPPYCSDWPDVPSSAEFTRLVPRPDLSAADRFDPRRAENAIHFSVMDGDFAKYIIGADHTRGPWLSSRLSDEPWIDPDDLMAELEDELSASSSKALSKYRTEERQHLLESVYVELPERVKIRFLKATGESSDSDQVAELAPEESTDDKDRDSSQESVERSRTIFLATLSATQREKYLSIERARACSSGESALGSQGHSEICLGARF